MMKNNTWAYLFIRLGVGLSLLGHGMVRLPKLHAFSQGMVNKFEGTLLPQIMVLPYSYALPVAEFIVGLLLSIGLYTRQSAIASGLLMATLVIGTCALEDWGALPSQMIHIAFISALLTFIEHNKLSLDSIKNISNGKH